MPDGLLTEFASVTSNSATGVDFTDIKPVTEAYRLYLGHKYYEQGIIKFTSRECPEWMKNYLSDTDVVIVEN